MESLSLEVIDGIARASVTESLPEDETVVVTDEETAVFDESEGDEGDEEEDAPEEGEEDEEDENGA